MWSFCEYIGPKFSISSLIQQENKSSYNTFVFISNKSLYLKNLIWLEKMSMIFGFSIKKKCLKIIYYIINLENIADQYNKP